MKTKFITLFLLSFLFCSTDGFCVEGNDNSKGEQLSSTAVQTLQIVSSPELNDLATTWLAGFGVLHPNQKIILSSQTEVTPLKEGNLYLLSTDNQKLVSDKSVWKMVIGHDLVVPVINTKNPLLEEINKKGVIAEDLAKLISDGTNWSMVINGAAKTPVKCYITDNQQVITKIADFTKIDQTSISATKVTTAAELILLVQQNVNAVGFCKLTDALNQEKNAFAGQINILPVDKNRNGRIDSFENIYTNPSSLTRGAWIGKYPRELCGDIYAMSAVKPTNQSALDFMTYVTGDGQDLIKPSGYSILSSTERKANLLILSNPVPPTDSGKKAPFIPLSWLLSLGAIILILLFAVLFNFKRSKQPTIEGEDIEITPALNENSILAPRGLYYDKTHTWAFMEQDGMVKIGIDDFIKHITGPLTQLKMRSPGERVRKGERILTIIRDGKQLNLYSPVSGFIRKQNESLLSTPSKISTAPFTEGWVYQIEPGNWVREASFMFMFEKYREWLEDEFTRLKDFLAVSANSNTVVYQHVVLQDGGELKDNVLSDLGPELWEDFQTRFIDTSK
jgi:glycine cleavage system H lipoate-binding protein